jgi:DNA-binding transcriptional regulator LsrR (DeoR family)
MARATENVVDLFDALASATVSIVAIGCTGTSETSCTWTAVSNTDLSKVGGIGLPKGMFIILRYRD